jgi:hypothetical protein
MRHGDAAGLSLARKSNLLLLPPCELYDVDGGTERTKQTESRNLTFAELTKTNVGKFVRRGNEN